MEAYTSFAQVYDLFMDNVPYEQWCDFIDEILKEYQIRENILLDLGCGTGKMTRIMAAKGYDMIGVDYSAEMLDIARNLDYEEQLERELAAWEEEEDGAGKARDEEGSGGTADLEDFDPEYEDSDPEHENPEAEHQKETGKAAAAAERKTEHAADEYDFSDEFDLSGEEYYQDAYEGERTPTIWLCQDMRELELYGTIGACYCACDSLNYLMSEEDVLKVFKLVNNYLFPGGIFIFDINSVYKYEKLLAENTIAENRPEGSFIWENFYDPETRVNVYDLTLFIREDLVLEEADPDFGDGNPGGLASKGNDPKTNDPEEEEEPVGVAYYKFHETHYQKCYSLRTIQALLAEAGMEFVAAYDAYTRNPVRRNSEKITIIAREKGKTTGSQP